MANDDPKKREKRAGTRLEYEVIRLENQLLDRLKIPRHRAPGEAEAECAKLQSEGIVDAVWSDDADTLMFSCTHLIRQHKVDNKPVPGYVRVYKAETIRRKHDLDANSLVMLAMLAGGNYCEKGLPGCGARTAAITANNDQPENETSPTKIHEAPQDGTNASSQKSTPTNKAPKEPKKNHKSKADVEHPPPSTSPRPVFRLPPSLPLSIIELLSDEHCEIILPTPPLQTKSQERMESIATRVISPESPRMPELIPGEITDAAALRALRAASALLRPPLADAVLQSSSRVIAPLSSKKVVEVIDLT